MSNSLIGTYKKTKEQIQKAIKTRRKNGWYANPEKTFKKMSAVHKGNKNRWIDGLSRTPERKHKYIVEYGKKKREKQAGREKSNQCEICGAFGKICFDHNHETGKFRGWICDRCNSVLGFVKDNIELLDAMIKYLIKK